MAIGATEVNAVRAICDAELGAGKATVTNVIAGGLAYVKIVEGRVTYEIDHFDPTLALERTPAQLNAIATALMQRHKQRAP